MTKVNPCLVIKQCVVIHCQFYTYRLIDDHLRLSALASTQLTSHLWNGFHSHACTGSCNSLLAILGIQNQQPPSWPISTANSQVDHSAGPFPTVLSKVITGTPRVSMGGIQPAHRGSRWITGPTSPAQVVVLGKVHQAFHRLVPDVCHLEASPEPLPSAGQLQWLRMMANEKANQRLKAWSMMVNQWLING